MRNWSEVKRLYSGPFGYHPSGRELMDAIAEIEQLRQDKAELVTVLKEIVPAKNCYGWWCPTCKEEVPGVWVTHNEYHETCGTYLGDSQPGDWTKDARELLAKHGGEPK